MPPALLAVMSASTIQLAGHRLSELQPSAHRAEPRVCRGERLRDAAENTQGQVSVGGWFALVDGVLIFAGSLLPWTQAHFFGESLDRSAMRLGALMGSSIVELVTLVLGVITGLVGLSAVVHSEMSLFVQCSPTIAAVVVVALALLSMGVIQHFVQEVRATSSAASGSLGAELRLLFVGRALATIRGLVLRAARGPSQ